MTVIQPIDTQISALVNKRAAYRLFADFQTMVALQPEELAGAVLELVKGGMRNAHGRFSITSIADHVKSIRGTEGPDQAYYQIVLALGEAFGWLETAGLIMADPREWNSGQWRLLTRRGESIHNKQQFLDFSARKRAGG